MWIGYEPQEIANDLVDVLMRAVNLDLIYLRFADSRSVIEASRSRQHAGGLDAVRTAVAKLLRSETGVTHSIADFLEGARPLRTLVLRSGAMATDVMVAASTVADFPTDIDRLLLTMSLNQAVAALAGRRVVEVMEENRFLRTEIDDLIHMGSVIGVSAAMRSLLSDVDRVAPTDATVLITGETGTGKELSAVPRAEAKVGEAQPFSLQPSDFYLVLPEFAFQIQFFYSVWPKERSWIRRRLSGWDASSQPSSCFSCSSMAAAKP